MKHFRSAAALVLSLAFLMVSPALAQGSRGPTGDIAVLAGTAVTCTNSMITGDVAVYPGIAVTQTNCTIAGTVHSADTVAAQAYRAFLLEYDRLARVACDVTLSGNLAGLTLAPGVYCVDAASTTTGGTLTLSGPSNGIWLFKIGTSGTGALTGTDFSVVLSGGAQPCNVTWWVAEAATLTTSNFVGTIYAGAAITVTGGTYDGNAFAKAAVTMTGTDVTGCEGHSRGNPRQRCNQGVGNGPESCDPGNSNQGDPSRSNDERGGTPGKPGRKGGKG